MNPDHTTYKLSPITRDDDGRFTFTLTTNEPYEEQAIGHYRTNEGGLGLWAWTPTGGNLLDGERAYEWKQILGTSQIDLSYGDRRATIAQWALQGDPAYDQWLEWNAYEDTKSHAKEYFRGHAA